MEIAYSLFYHNAVIRKDLPKLSSEDKRRIKLAIETKLMTHPDIFGIPLRRSMKGYRKIRVGDMRLVFMLEKMTVIILAIQHRSIVYKEVLKRI